MTEQQIRDGYARLDGALAPPMDTAERVGRRVAARRRRRRTAVAGVATLGVLAVGGTVVALASGDDGTAPSVASDTGSAPVSTLVMTRPDGSTYAFEDVTVTCTAPAWDDTEAAGRIWAFSPRHVEGGHAVEPFLYFQGVVDEIRGGRTVDVTSNGPDDNPAGALVLFMADSPDGTRRANEVSSTASGSGSGTVRVVRASCDPTPVLELEVDATLASELRGRDDLQVSGGLH
ncbi:hypothetical protein ASC77_18135 [Nocardioides sp. Root1257]|uniref:hypothetical protein n=1 Tax=unclassified Nocardioides TaxID=2615069 RepID=UPI0006F77CBF|nr:MULTISPECIES: hypothetical protein [unclassified Nocardioides]KQW47098.1 hypothetical protein ASC77_18135 [Nocardioides sp. Root1257]KRC43843.1 hypothetical protein ASE24_19090 [Nocardioides sp. Root224]